MMTRWILSVVAISIALCASCTKKVKQQPVYVDTALTSYFNYDTGSYWIYYDSLTNREDSLYVDEIYTRKPYYDDITPEEHHFIGLHCQNDNSNWVINLVSDQSVLTITRQLSTVVDVMTKKWPFYIGKIEQTETKPHSTYECDYYPEITVLGVLYKDVYKIRWYQDDAYDEYLLCRNGFIQMQLNRDIKKKYSLLRYKIVRK